MKFFISFLISFVLIFTNTVYASDTETHEGSSFDDDNSDGHSRGGSFSLGDVVHDRHGTGSRGGGFQEFVGYEGDDFNAQNFVRQPILTALSSFTALTPEVIDDAVASLLLNEDFLDSIIFDPYNKIMSWNADTARHGGGAIEHLLNDTSYEGVAEGFYKCDYTNWYTGPGYGYYYFCSNIPNCYFTRVGNLAIICSFDATYNSTIEQYNNSTVPTADFQGRDSDTWRYNHYLDNTQHLYAEKSVALVTSEYRNKFPQTYSDALSAVRAFYNHVPQEVTKPNGKGYVSLFNGNQIATSTNVYNRDWTSVITTNFNDYGNTFNSSVVNNYYYTAPSNTAPSYWYDVYSPSEPIVIPSHDYDDLTDITLANPNIVANHNFITDVFSSIPVVISTLFISLLLLSIVIMFLKG